MIEQSGMTLISDGVVPPRAAGSRCLRGALVAALLATALAACTQPPPPSPVQLIPPVTRIACNATKGFTGPERCVWWHDNGGDVEGPYYAGLIVVAHGGYWIAGR